MLWKQYWLVQLSQPRSKLVSKDLLMKDGDESHRRLLRHRRGSKDEKDGKDEQGSTKGSGMPGLCVGGWGVGGGGRTNMRVDCVCCVCCAWWWWWWWC